MYLQGHGNPVHPSTHGLLEDSQQSCIRGNVRRAGSERIHSRPSPYRTSEPPSRIVASSHRPRSMITNGPTSRDALEYRSSIQGLQATESHVPMSAMPYTRSTSSVNVSELSSGHTPRPITIHSSFHPQNTQPRSNIEPESLFADLTSFASVLGSQRHARSRSAHTLATEQKNRKDMFEIDSFFNSSITVVELNTSQSVLHRPPREHNVMQNIGTRGQIGNRNRDTPSSVMVDNVYELAAENEDADGVEEIVELDSCCVPYQST